MGQNNQIEKINHMHKVTGLSRIECRNALIRMNWDIENAINYLCNSNENVIDIGQTREVYNSNEYPSIKNIINNPLFEKRRIIEYMKQSKVEAVAPGVITDQVNPEIQFAEIYYMTDGTYGWRSDVIYYVDNYDMELPEEFIKHVLSHS